MSLTRRSVLLGAASAAAGAGFIGMHPFLRTARAAEPQPLRIPELIDARARGQSVALKAQAGRTGFFPGRPSATLGYNGAHLGPTIRLRKGDDVQVAVTNALDRETSVHWHGLLIPASEDGGPHQGIRPGETWRPTLAVRQPAATLFYHSHVHGLTAEQVYSGLAGLLLVTDDEEQALGLPSEYGVDDLPLLIQDRQFEEGRLVLPGGMMTVMHGRRGDTILVNGTPDAFARVPGRLVRLRLVNGSNARVYELSFDDGRAFHWIASEGGLLERPVELRSIRLAPGERTEILVDFSDGRAVALKTAPDTSAPMMMGMMARLREGAASLLGGGGQPVLRFEPREAGSRKATIPERLVSRERVDPALATRRRRFVLTMGMGGMMGGGMAGMMGGMRDMLGGGPNRGMDPEGMMGTHGINGRPFDMNRIDERVRLGDTEIWEVSGEMFAHPFHVHGVHFEVLSRGGGRPDVRDQGLRDTVLVKEPVELLVRFTQPAETKPFMYHCHILEHEDNGMMGQFLAT